MAHAASKAIKKSEKEEKTDTSKKTEDSGEAKEQKKESSHVGKVKRSVKAKKRHRTRTPYDCRVKLVPCEKDPAQKKWMRSLKNRYKDPDSEYKVVYGPSTCNRMFQSQANGSLQEKKAAMAAVNSGPKRKSKYLDGSHNMSRPPALANAKPASLNVVVVHPKPGAKIVTLTTGRKSKPSRVQELISNPDVVISPKVSRVTTTGGKTELQCNMCSKTYVMARDLVNHKHLAHKASQHMCITCAKDFPSAEELCDHECSVKNQCDLCGLVCKNVLGHKQKAHPKAPPNHVMCQVCCFTASSQEELDAHICGGRPKIKYSARASSAVMVYPPTDTTTKGDVSSRPNIYVDIGEPPALVGDGASGNASSRSSPMQFLCEVCLNMYPSSATLASHKCNSAVEVDPDPSSEPGSSKVPVQPKVAPQPPPPQAPAMSMPSPMMPFGMDVMPEVEQLAKFYSSVVFKE
ncbi:hypothetical protein ACOMHN_017283 [Nucella lapillus]